VEARNRAEDLQPRIGVAANLDLRFDRPKGVERLVEQIPHDAGLWLIAGGTDIANRQVVVHAQVTFDKAGDLPVMRHAIVALENKNVAAAGAAPIALAVPLLVWMGKRRADRITQRRCVAGFGGTNAVRQTCFFHCASLRTA
jgi:hypothetical protein